MRCLEVAPTVDRVCAYAALERLHGQLVEIYLAHPKVFDPADALAPVCIKMMTSPEQFAMIGS